MDATALRAMQAPINSGLGKSIGSLPAASFSFAIGLVALGVLAITLNRPDVLNAFNNQLTTELSEALRAVFERVPDEARARAKDTPARHSVVLPIPAAPSRIRAEGPPDTDPMKDLTWASSASRPRIP